MPHQANPQGTAFGGAIVAWIDMVAAMVAQRHCGKEVVTAVPLRHHCRHHINPGHNRSAERCALGIGLVGHK
ncbi:hypothetical protein ES703_77170 [subsurface metagenome]